MDTENCTNLYLQVCQTLLTCNCDDPSSFADLYKLLPWFRQSLTCCVCSNLVKDPMASTESACQHFVCAECNGKPMILKPSCSWCKDYTYFERNGHLAMLVMCFSKVCEQIVGSQIMKHIVEHEEDQRLSQEAACEGSSDGRKDFPLGKSCQKKKSKGKKEFPYRSRRRYKQLNFSLTKVLKDGLAVKKDSDLLQWLDKNVSANSDTSQLTPMFLQAQAQLCHDSLSLPIEALDTSASDGKKRHSIEGSDGKVTSTRDAKVVLLHDQKIQPGKGGWKGPVR